MLSLLNSPAHVSLHISIQKSPYYPFNIGDDIEYWSNGRVHYIRYTDNTNTAIESHHIAPKWQYNLHWSTVNVDNSIVNVLEDQRMTRLRSSCVQN